MSKVIHNFSVYFWLSALMAVSFAGSAFGFAGLAGGVLGLLIAGSVGFISLTMAYNKREQKNALKQTSDGVAIAGMVLFLLTMFSVGVIAGLTVLLFFLHTALNLALREHRQTSFGLLVNFIVLMTGAVNTFSAGYLVFMLAFCVCASFYMALIFVDKQRYEMLENSTGIDNTNNSDSNLPSQAQPHSQSQQVDELHYVGEWRSLDKIIIAMCISLLAGTIYLLTPHVSAGNLGRIQIEGFGEYDNSSLEEQIFPEEADIDDYFYNEAETDSQNNDSQNNSDQPSSEESDSKPLPLFGTPSEQLDNSIYYYIKSDKPRYMQTHTSTYFDGSSWHKLQYGWRKLPSEYQDFTLYPEEPNAGVGITVVKESSYTEILTTDNTVGIRFPSYWVAGDYYDQLKSGHPLKKDTSYELMVFDTFDENTGRMIDSNQASPDDKDLQLPDNLDPRIKELADGLLITATSDIDKANVLENHLRTHYEYTLDTLSNQNNIPLADFLFGSQRGHCEYFATSMAVMLRQQGIPARMITGFVASDYNPVTGFYEVKGTNGHAWVQAYVNGSWTLYEATGAYQTPQEDAQAQQQTRNTNEVIKDYLEQRNNQDELLEEVKELTIWEQIQLALRSFWYAIVMGFSFIVATLKVVLPLLLISAVIFGSASWFGWKRWQSKRVERADYQGYKDLLTLNKKVIEPTDNELMKAYIHDHLTIYQDMLTRHNLPRPVGQQIEEFVQTLTSRNLCTTVQGKMLIEMTNAHFYLTHECSMTQAEIHALFVQLYKQGRDEE